MKQTSLGRKLRVLRAERGLTLREASALTGVTKETISGLERGIRHPHDVTLAKLAEGYGVPVEELLEDPVLAGKAEAPETGQDTVEYTRTAQEWARRQNARLHGLTAEEWDDYVRDHGTVEGLGRAWNEIHDEARMLHAALNFDRVQHPQDRGRRRELGRGLRDLRVRRYGDLQAAAMLLHAEALVDEIFEAMREEARA